MSIHLAPGIIIEEHVLWNVAHEFGKRKEICAGNGVKSECEEKNEIGGNN